MAARVSPVEAVRYSEGGTGKKKQKKGGSRVSVAAMAWANLGRSKGKTFVTILSLALAVVLLQMTALFTNGFDMDKYLQDKSACDFILADGGYFNNNVRNWGAGNGIVPESVIQEVTSREEVTAGGRVYGQLSGIQQFAPEKWVRDRMLYWGNDQRIVDFQLENLPHTQDGRVMENVRTYGMEPFILDTLKVVDGDLSDLYEPGSRSVAAVMTDDDYGKAIPDSHWAKVGDKVTLRVPESWEYYVPETGEAFDTPEACGGRFFVGRPAKYHDETFTVAALVLVPGNLCYRYYGTDEFVLNDRTFQEITGQSGVMLYAFDTGDEEEADMEKFLHDYTQNINPRYGYESKQLYVEEFESFRSMFVTIGGLLSLIVGTVGILNFLNAILTGILTRKRELAMLQSIGMTGRQLKAMLVTEGLFYALGAIVLALVFSLAMGPVAASVLKVFWFFTYRPTFLPIAVVAPIFAALGCLVPLLVYQAVSRQTVVERLRESEG